MDKSNGRLESFAQPTIFVIISRGGDSGTISPGVSGTSTWLSFSGVASFMFESILIAQWKSSNKGCEIEPRQSSKRQKIDSRRDTSFLNLVYTFFESVSTILFL